MQCLDTPPATPTSAADAHAVRRKALELIHSKPAALRVVYYKRVRLLSGPALRRRARRRNSAPSCQQGSEGSADAFCQFNPVLKTHKNRKQTPLNSKMGILQYTQSNRNRF